MNDAVLLLFTFAGLFAAGLFIGIGVGRRRERADLAERLAEALGEE